MMLHVYAVPVGLLPCNTDLRGRRNSGSVLPGRTGVDQSQQQQDENHHGKVNQTLD